jgi:glutamine synthetase adenylyltransferase
MLIAGDKHYFDLIIKKLSQRILMLDNEVIKKELLEMRNKLVGSSEYLVNLKKVSGGLIDIAFIIGYYYLLNLNNLPYYSNSTIERINYLIEHNNQFREIENNFILLKKFEIYYQIVSSSKSVKIDFEDENFYILSEIFEKKSINELQDLFRKVFQSNIRIFNNTFQ